MMIDTLSPPYLVSGAERLPSQPLTPLSSRNPYDRSRKVYLHRLCTFRPAQGSSLPTVLTTRSFNKAQLERRSAVLAAPGKVQFDLIQGRIEAARAVDEQSLACMMEAHVPMPSKSLLLPRHIRLDLKSGN